MILIAVAVVLQVVGGIRVRVLDSIPRRRRWCNAVDQSQAYTCPRPTATVLNVLPVRAPELVLHGGRRVLDVIQTAPNCMASHAPVFPRFVRRETLPHTKSHSHIHVAARPVRGWGYVRVPRLQT